MYLIVKQHIHVSAGIGYCPEVVATATNLSVARRHAAAYAAAGLNIVGIYECSSPPMGESTTARPVRRVLGGTTLGAAEPVVWWGHEPPHTT